MNHIQPQITYSLPNHRCHLEEELNDRCHILIHIDSYLEVVLSSTCLSNDSRSPLRNLDLNNSFYWTWTWKAQRDLDVTFKRRRRDHIFGYSQMHSNKSNHPIRLYSYSIIYSTHHNLFFFLLMHRSTYLATFSSRRIVHRHYGDEKNYIRTLLLGIRLPSS